jgi:hypothetical protein
MRSAAPSQKRAWLAKFASLITLLALVVAPACAPLCAAQTCAHVPASTEIGSHCHSQGVANGGAVYLQTVQSCGAPELQAANLPSADKRGSLQRVRAEAFPGKLGVPFPGYSSLSAPVSVFIDVNLESSPHSCSAISTVVLRV